MLLAAFAVLNILLYVSYLYLFAWESGFSTIKPLYWYFATLVGGAALIATHRSCWSPSRSVVWLLVWCVVFSALLSASYLLSSQSAAALQATINYGEATLVMAVIAITFQAGRAYHWAAVALIGTVLLSVALNVVDFFSLTDLALSTTAGRAAGFYGNPNTAGKMLVMGMVLALHVLAKGQRFPFCLFVGLGVALTFSRSAMLLWAVAVFALAWFEAFVLPRIYSVSTVSAIVLILAVSLAAGQWIGVFQQAGLGDRLNANTQSRIGTGFLSQDDFSSQERGTVAKQGLQLFLKAPVFGHGIGATQEWSTRVSTHNMYLLLGAEQGIVGVLLFLGFLWIVWRSGTPEARIVAVLYAISGLFSHNNFEQPAIQILVAMAVAGAGKKTLQGQKQRAAKPPAVGKRA